MEAMKKTKDAKGDGRNTAKKAKKSETSGAAGFAEFLHKDTIYRLFGNENRIAKHTCGGCVNGDVWQTVFIGRTFSEAKGRFQKMWDDALELFEREEASRAHAVAVGAIADVAACLNMAGDRRNAQRLMKAVWSLGFAASLLGISTDEAGGNYDDGGDLA